MVGIKPATAESSAVSENNVPVFSESLDRTEEALETFQLVKHNEYIDRSTNKPIKSEKRRMQKRELSISIL